MQGHHAYSISLAHNLPALSESSVSALLRRLDAREDSRFAAVKGVGGVRAGGVSSMPPSGGACRNAHGVAGSESRLSAIGVLMLSVVCTRAGVAAEILAVNSWMQSRKD